MTTDQIKDTYGAKVFERMFDALLNHSVHTLVIEVLNRLSDQEVQVWASRIINEDREDV